MPFQLNEAPLYVLKKIKRHDQMRHCCLATSLLCCIPTIGCSISADSGSDDNEFSGCYPRSPSVTAKACLEELVDSLNRILVKEGEADSTQQAQTTLLLLQQALALEVIEMRYKYILEDAYEYINIRLKHEQAFSKVVCPKAISSNQLSLL